ncbi:MaoC family dehydratase [Oceanibaculum pacificum]|uniref:MaoC-like domain-containing protein n=1 Tax=Oceanibaculum pacificum TaxID=580166 RepID=A0A154VS23_9PROT|nr:MaoC/PaaZ C-terminal domain-containing protein [Oceanibaculum pacificum]KZD04104.1 hypothetical protein AUP43_03085 [Oceanibaculum pacificum]
MTTAQHRVAQIFADDLAVGQVFAGEPRGIGEEHFSGFAALTGDSHPIHYHEAYAAKTQFGKRLAHGLLLVSMGALGATPLSHRLEDAMIAFVEQGCRFVKPVFIGETLTSRFEVTAIDLKPHRNAALVRFALTLLDHAGSPVLEGHHTYLLKCRPQGTDKVA